MPNATLDAAYWATDYRVDDSPVGLFVIRVGEPCPAADRVLAAHGQSDWAFVTACNPRSEFLSPAENCRRMAELEAVCLFRDWPHYPGAGVSRDGSWPAEPSVLIVGVSEAEAVEVARHFGQNALVIGRFGEPVRLVWVG